MLQALIGAYSKFGSLVDFVHQLVYIILDLLLLHLNFILECFLTFIYLQGIMCWHVKILVDSYWH
jgi:hypothetical protein